jgi:hypothetical protein
MIAAHETEPPTWLMVTGAPRSGTTVFGTACAAPTGTVYLHEPFNPMCGSAAFGPLEPMPPRRPEEHECLARVVADIRAFRLQGARQRFVNDTALSYARRRIIGSRTDHSMRVARWSRPPEAVVVKDPVGVFLTEALVCEFGWKAVAIVRSPVAVVSSMTRLGWDSSDAAVRCVEALAATGVAADIAEALARSARDSQRAVQHAVRWCAANHWIRHLHSVGLIEVVTFADFRSDPTGAVNVARASCGLRPATVEDLERSRRRERSLERWSGPFGSAIDQLGGNREAEGFLTDEEVIAVCGLAEPLRDWLVELGERW